jgi:hypothetical protein
MTGDAATILEETMLQAYLVSKTFLFIGFSFNPDMVIRLSKALGRSSQIWLKIQLDYDSGQAMHHEAGIEDFISRLLPHRNTRFSAIS